MKSFYLKEQSIGEELTRLELISDQKSTSNNNIVTAKSKGESGSELDDFIPEDLEPISAKLRTFKIESPTLNTPFSEDGVKSATLKRNSKSQKELPDSKESKPRKSRVSSFNILTPNKDSTSFSGFFLKIKSENAKDSHKQKRTSSKSSEKRTGSVPRRKRSEQPESTRTTATNSRKGSDSLHNYSRNSDKSREDTSTDHSFPMKSLFGHVAMRDEPITPSFKITNQ